MKEKSSNIGKKLITIFLILAAIFAAALFLPTDMLKKVFSEEAVGKITEFRSCVFEWTDTVKEKISGTGNDGDTYIKPILKDGSGEEVSEQTTQVETTQSASGVQEMAASVTESLSPENTIYVLGAVSLEEMEKVVQLVFSEPEFFWLDNHYSYSTEANGNVILSFKSKYSDIDVMQQQIDAVADQILNTIPDGSGDYEKALIIYSDLVNRIAYNHGESKDSDFDIYGALVEGSAVCEGYSKAFQYLMEKAGVSCAYYAGEATNSSGTRESHSWNSAWLEGELYYFDVTWADQDDGEVHFDWFGITSDEMLASHSPSEVFPMEASSARGCNYYYRNGMILDSSDTQSIVSLFASQGNRADFKCSSAEVFEEFKNLLQDEYSIWSLCQMAGISSNRWTYSFLDNLYTVHIRFS